MTPDQILKTYGVSELYYGRQPEWRDLLTQLNRLYQDRLAEIPWLPEGWTYFVLPSLMGRSDEFYVIAPATANYYDPVTQTTKYGADFLDTPEKKEWWNNLARMSSQVVSEYAAGRVAEGNKIMQKAYDNVEMWNNAIKMTNLLAAPVNFLVDAADTYSKYRSAITGLAMVGLVGLVIYKVTR